VKQCTICQHDKPETDFRKHQRACKACDSAKSLTYFHKRSANDATWKTARASKAKQGRRTDTARYLYQGAKIRAKKRGIAFDLELSDIIVPQFCPVLGCELVVSETQAYCSPTLDRFDNGKGYVKGNVRVISWRANSLKSDATTEEIEKVLYYMKKTVDV